MKIRVNPKRLATNLKKYRKIKKFNQADLRNATGNVVSLSWIRYVEQGGADKIEESTLQILAEALGISLTELVGMDDAEELVLKFPLAPGTKLSETEKSKIKEIMRVVVKELAKREIE